MPSSKADRINHPEINTLVTQLFEEDDIKAIHEVYKLKKKRRVPHWRLNPHETMNLLRQRISPIDRKIGGIGIDRLVFGPDKPESYGGNYGKDKRALHRTIGYAIWWCTWHENPRGSIVMSCEHIQISLRERLLRCCPEFKGRSLGNQVQYARSRKLFPARLSDQLKLVYKLSIIAKHEYSEESVEIVEDSPTMGSRVFNTREAISMYFVCRKLHQLINS